MNADETEELGHHCVPCGPATPTQKEVDEHLATGHAQFRSWCKHCIAAKAHESPHYRAPAEQLPDAVPTLSIDYVLWPKTMASACQF